MLRRPQRGHRSVPSAWTGCAALLIGLAGAPPVLAQPASPTSADAGAATEAGSAARRLRVAVAGSEPFVTTGRGGEDFGGVAIDVWRALTPEVPALADATLTFHDSVDAALSAVVAGEADVALGPISITAERATRVAFSQPYYRSSLSILAPATESVWSRVAPFVSKAFAAGVLVLMLVLVGVGTLLWLSERRANPEQFPAGPVPGIANGVWLALVTMTTVGYGDLTPVTRKGRLVAGAWMIIAMITASSLTASIATALTLSQLETPGISTASDLDGRPTAVIEPSPAASFVREAGARVVSVQDVEEGIRALQNGRADALVWDRPVLAYYLSQHPESDLSLSTAEYDTRGYGLAARHGDQPLLRQLDVAVLSLQESGRLERILARWFDH